MPAIDNTPFGLLAAAVRPSIDARDSVLLVLRTQNALIQSHQDQLLQVVFWSLGVVAAVATLLIGFGWFLNFKVYERDKSALASDLESKIREGLSSALDTLRKEAQESQRLLTDRMEATADSAAKRVSAPLSANISRVDALATEIGFIAFQQEADEWRQEGVLTNALRSYMRLIQHAMSTGRSFMVPRALDQIKAALRQIEQDTGRIRPDAELLSDLHDLLSRCRQDHSIVVQAIEHQLEQLAR